MATLPEKEPLPRRAAGGPDAERYGSGAGYPTGDRKTYLEVGSLVGSHSHMDQLFKSRLVRKPPTASRLVRVAEPQITWRWQNTDLTLDDYLARHPTTGLLVAQDDRILVERYQYARTDVHRLYSLSMSKTVTAMLVGIALEERAIRSIDDPAAAYVPELTGIEYGRTSVRHLLQMSSGVRFTEDYGGADDFERLRESTIRLNGPGGVSAVTPFNERIAPAGTKFAYSSAETQVLGLVLARATGRPVAEYLEQKIWQPMGAEADATWLIDNSGQETTFGGLNAVLRDYARLGLLLAHDGHWHGRQIIPTSWILDATTVRADQPHLRPGVATPIIGYGYQTWIVPTKRRMFMLWGARGQRIHVDPQNRLIMVNTSVHQQATDIPRLEEMWAVWWAFAQQFGR